MSSEKEKNSTGKGKAVAKIKVGHQWLDAFGDKILLAIDNNILDGFGADAALKTLKLRYVGPAAIPPMSEIEDYVERRRQKLFDDQDERMRIQILLGQNVDLTVVDQRNTQALNFARLAGLCNLIEEVKPLTRNSGDARYFDLIIKANSAISEIQLTQNKIDAYESMELQKLQAVASVVMGRVMATIADVFKATYGEKGYQEFTKALEKGLDNMDYHALSTAVAFAIKDATKKDTILDEE